MLSSHQIVHQSRQRSRCIIHRATICEPLQSHNWRPKRMHTLNSFNIKLWSMTDSRISAILGQHIVDFVWFSPEIPSPRLHSRTVCPVTRCGTFARTQVISPGSTWMVYMNSYKIAFGWKTLTGVQIRARNALRSLSTIWNYLVAQRWMSTTIKYLHSLSVHHRNGITTPSAVITISDVRCNTLRYIQEPAREENNRCEWCAPWIPCNMRSSCLQEPWCVTLK